jgi:NADPH:quinone reductase-like Zn-dependent oxidoreductase
MSPERCGGVKAVAYVRYGGPEVLRLEDVPKPSPATGQVLVRVAATLAIPIDRIFLLEEVPAALAYVGGGQALGKDEIVPS